MEERLASGFYEDLINNLLNKRIEYTEKQGAYCKKETIDPAELPKFLADYIAKVLLKKFSAIIKNKITSSDINSSDLVKANADLVEIANKILRQIDNFQNELIVEQQKQNHKKFVLFVRGNKDKIM